MVVAAVKLVSSTCGARIVSSGVSAILRTHANFANVSGARRGRSAKILQKKDVSPTAYIYYICKADSNATPPPKLRNLEIFCTRTLRRTQYDYERPHFPIR